MSGLDDLLEIRETSRVAAANIFVGTIVAALGNALIDALNALFRAIQADLNQAHKETLCNRLFNCPYRPEARERGLDRKVLTGMQALSRSKKDFAAGCYGRLSRIASIDSRRDCVCLEQVVSAGKVNAPNNAAFA